MEHVHKARLVKGWQKTKGAERNRKKRREKNDVRDAHGGKKKRAPASQPWKRMMVKTRGSDDVANGGGYGKEHSCP